MQTFLSNLVQNINLDNSVNEFANSLTNTIMPSMANIADIVSTIGGTKVVLAVSILIVIYLILRKKWQNAIILSCAVGSASVLVLLFKGLFMRLRPENALQFLGDYSFPSGHATMAAVFFTIIIYLFVPKIRSNIWRSIFIIVSIIAVLLIGLSRVVLNVHWASDIIAGWALGVFCATATILIVRYVGVLLINRNINK